MPAWTKRDPAAHARRDRRDRSARPRLFDAGSIAHVHARRGAAHTAARSTTRPAARRALGEGGFTLIEVLIAIVVLVVGLLALLTTLDTAVKASMITRAREGATNLARELIEDSRTIPYAQIVPTSIEGQLQKMGGLADASTSTSGWQIERRGFVYTVEVKECAIDDPKDGLATEATHVEAKTFCAGQANWKAGETVDTEPEDLKRVTAKVSWTIQKRTADVEQVFTMTAAGQGIGLLATKLELTAPVGFSGTATAPVITAATTKALTFSVSFAEGASFIDWSLEGAKQEEIAVSTTATSATFSWIINEEVKKIYVEDGTYQVSAQTVNSTGVIGPPISISVRLIRGKPVEPSGRVGDLKTVYANGAPTEAVELQWKANSERDVIGYRVHGPSGELICPESTETLITTTSCIGFGAGGKPAEGQYSVAALYRNAADEVEEGPSGKVPIGTESAPSAPKSLTAATNSNGSVTLTWSPPSTGTPSFYRIYRGTTNYTSRYGITFSSECKVESSVTICSFTDTEPEAGADYWIAAASSHLVESEFVGPVT